MKRNIHVIYNIYEQSLLNNNNKKKFIHKNINLKKRKNLISITNEHNKKYKEDLYYFYWMLF